MVCEENTVDVKIDMPWCLWSDIGCLSFSSEYDAEDEGG